MLDRPVLLDMTVEEIGAYLSGMKQPAFRAKQIFTWLHKGVSFADMTNLPKALREALAAHAYDIPMHLEQSFPSQRDHTVKFLNACKDGNIVESVLMQYHYGHSLCISTQVGCKMGCAFCASTLGGCVRNLSAGEMLAQVLLANRYLGISGHVGHIVLMGSGEPLDNYAQVVKFLRLVNHADGLNISLRAISLSTCGIIPRIRDLAQEALPITLSISLHAPNDALRQEIMPIAKQYPLQELIIAVREYVEKTGRRVVFEYALIDGFNCEPSHAKELAKLISGFQCHVNLIPLNPVKERALAPASPKQVQLFLQTLESLHVSATVRREMGTDIAGACGQLRNRHLNNATETDMIGN